MKKYLFSQTVATSLVAISLLLFPLHGSGFAQSRETNPNENRGNLEQAGENLEDAGNNLLEATNEATNEAQQQFAETANVVEQKANWGWLGLLGLLGLFGLAGNRKAKVIHHHEVDPKLTGTALRKQ
ncbi:MAG: WGxxGxxG family protein [Cyanobacteriota bacterium]|nr:WGxxGxxG family protein [Cyanobacteriota bacterium]